MPRWRSRILTAAGRVPLPVACLLVLLLGSAPAGLTLSRSRSGRAVSTGPSLGAIAREAGCRLSEFDRDPGSNPPVSGRVDERVATADGSYVGRRSPSTLAAVHALLHGRVVMQYRPALPSVQVARLDRFVRREPAGALLFANRTDMPQPVAAAAYLTLMTCRRVDARSIDALRAFRDRRGNFGQGF